MLQILYKMQCFPIYYQNKKPETDKIWKREKEESMGSPPLLYRPPTTIKTPKPLRTFFFFFNINHETKNKCKRLTGPWKSTNLWCVHIFHTMKWKFVQLSDRFPLIDNVTLWHGLDKCVCMCLIDDLKLNHGRIWFYIVH